MPNDWFEKIAHLAQSAGARLVVRSALNPMLWMCGVVCPLCWSAACLLRADPFVARFIVVVSAAPVLTTCGVAIYFAVRKPERLQSEDYQIRQLTLQLFREKGRRSLPDAALLERIMRPSDRSQNPGGEK